MEEGEYAPSRPQLFTFHQILEAALSRSSGMKKSKGKGKFGEQEENLEGVTSPTSHCQ